MRLIAAVLVALAVLAGAPRGWAQPDAITFRASDFAFTLGTRLWATSGYSTWSVRTGAVNPVSELRWRGVDSLVPEVNAEVVWKRRLVLLGSVGRGDIDDGAVLDDDFAFDDRRGRFSHGRSNVEEDYVFRATGDAGIRVADWTVPGLGVGFVDVLAGYQYWREKYTAFGGSDVSDFTPFGVPLVVAQALPPGRVLAHDFVWQSARVGARSRMTFPKGFAVSARTVVMPWTWLELEDVHPLRPDLRQNPSVRTRATGGFGYEVDGTVSYTIWRGLSVEAGFQYVKIDIEDGDVFSRGVTGTTRASLGQARTERYGPHVGLKYRF